MDTTFLIPVDFDFRNREHVYLLQLGLTSLGYSIAQDEISNQYYGDSTKQAVTDFQTFYGLQQNVNSLDETISKLNYELVKLPIICGYVTNDYDTPIINVEIKFFHFRYDGMRREVGNTISLSDGSYRFFVPLLLLAQQSEEMGDLVESATTLPLANSSMSLVADLYQNDQLKYTSDIFSQAEMVTTMNFKSPLLSYIGLTEYHILLSKLGMNG